MWKASLRCFFFTHFAKLFISLVVTNSHLFLFAFLWNMALMCIPVYNLESYVYFYFRWVFEEVLCHSFNFVNMRFVAKVIFFGYLFFSIKFYRNIYFHGKLITEFCFFFFYSRICSLGRTNSFLQKKIFSFV